MATCPHLYRLHRVFKGWGKAWIALERLKSLSKNPEVFKKLHRAFKNTSENSEAL